MRCCCYCYKNCCLAVALAPNFAVPVVGFVAGLDLDREHHCYHHLLLLALCICWSGGGSGGNSSCNSHHEWSRAIWAFYCGGPFTIETSGSLAETHSAQRYVNGQVHSHDDLEKLLEFVCLNS